MCELAREHVPRCGTAWKEIAKLHQEWLNNEYPGQGKNREGAALQAKFKSLIKDGSAPTGYGENVPEHITIAREAWLVIHTVAEARIVGKNEDKNNEARSGSGSVKKD